MSSPTRKTSKRIDLGVHRAANELARLAPEIELGWNELREALRDAGWPTRTPDDDAAAREPRGIESGDPESVGRTIDYSDPTGEQAQHLNRLHGDLETLQDHRHIIEQSTRALHDIARRHITEAPPAIPACSVVNCVEPVESRNTNRGPSFVGMHLVAGRWEPKPGASPVCGRHRKQAGRAA